jgi:polysaccharide deacetylase 2 family uncharacterized protein YibQ
MARFTKKKKLKKKKKGGAKRTVFRKLLLVLLFSAIVLFSLCTAGYVIFFRTVFAREFQPVQNEIIVFEEPDPPPHEGAAAFSEELSSLSEKSLPLVAIIIDDLGYHKKIGEDFLGFPIELTYSFLPFAPYTEKQEKNAFYSGKTVLLHLPLEPNGKEWNPGPGALFLSDPVELQKRKFEQDLALVPHAVGVNNHMGSRFTSNAAAMEKVLSFVKENGMFFIDSFTTAESKGLELAVRLKMRTGRRNIFLDNNRVKTDICGQLEKLVTVAESYGMAIGIGHPHLETYMALKECMPEYLTRVKFVSVTDIVKKYE